MLDGVVGGGTVAGCPSPAGRDAGRLDVADGFGRVRSVDRRPRPARLRLAPRRASVLRRLVVVVDVVSAVVLVLRRRRWSAHDHRVRTRQSGQFRSPAAAAAADDDDAGNVMVRGR